MKNYFYADWEMAEELADKISYCYRKYNVFIKIREKDIEILKDRIKFKVKLRPGTRLDDIKRFEKDVQVNLKLHLFQVIQEELNVYIIAYPKKVVDCGWRQLVKYFRDDEVANSMDIAHFIGFNAMGDVVINDLALYPHVLIAGTTGSGKSVAIKNLLVCTAFMYSPNKVQLLIGDMAGELLQFCNLPHLICPIIQDVDKFYYAMQQLKVEMERRIQLKWSIEYSKLPYIVCVVDEFPSFIIGTDAKNKSIRENIEEILRRGRHAKIHLVLAAHNPTKQRLKLDMSDIPTKMVFRVARLNNSVSILGEGGAEKLSGNGDMLFQSAQNERVQRIQGAFISVKDTGKMVYQIISKWKMVVLDKKSRFRISQEKFLTELEMLDTVKEESLINEKKGEEKLLAQIIIWVLKQDSISCNKLMKKFALGWNRANRILERLNELGIIEELDAKLSRKVLIDSVDGISEEVMQLLLKSGYSHETIYEAFL